MASVNLPSGYKQVEYLESTGAQWIKTNYTPVKGDSIIVSYALCSRPLSSTSYFTIFQAGSSDYRYVHSINPTNMYFKFFRTGTALLFENYSVPLYEWMNFQYSADTGAVMVLNRSENNEYQNELTGDTNFTLFSALDGTRRAKIRVRKTTIYTAYETKLNLIPCYRISDNKPGMYDLVTDAFYTNAGTGEFIVPSIKTSNDIRRQVIVGSSPHLETLTGQGSLQFTTHVSANLKECKIYFTPIQEGSGTPSPVNERPIHGWDGITVTATGRNLTNYLDSSNWRVASSATARVKPNEGTYFVDGNTVTMTRYHSVYSLAIILGQLKANITYTLSAIRTNTDGKAYIAKLDSEIADSYTCTRKFTIVHANDAVTFTPTEDGIYEVLYWSNNIRDISVANLQLEEGSQKSDYEPFGQSLTIPFPRTIYGGYLDLVRGEVVETWVSSILNGRHSITNSSSRFLVLNVLSGTVKNNGSGAISDKYVYSGSVYSSTAYGRFTIRDDDFYLTPPEGTEIGRTDIDTFRTWLSNNTPMFVAQLTTPVHIPLTDPPTIKTLKGINNLISNANGNVNISYWTH